MFKIVRTFLQVKAFQDGIEALVIASVAAGAAFLKSNLPSKPQKRGY